jgi:hypothetical protein
MSIHEGFLTKEGGSIKTWKRRWCVIKDDNILYYYTKRVRLHLHVHCPHTLAPSIITID